jgi:hypothetical protein
MIKMEQTKETKGLGGWLTIWHIILWGGLLTYFYNSVESVMDIFGYSLYNIGSINTFNFIIPILFLLHLVMIYLFLTKNTNFKVFGIIYLWSANIVLGLLIFMDIGVIGSIIWLIISIILTLYLKKSIRVRNTFINGRQIIKLKQ